MSRPATTASSCRSVTTASVAPARAGFRPRRAHRPGPGPWAGPSRSTAPPGRAPDSRSTCRSRTALPAIFSFSLITLRPAYVTGRREELTAATRPPATHHPHPLPDGPAGRRGPPAGPGRPHHPPQPRHRAPRAQALPGRWARRRAAPAPSGPATPLPARLGGRAGPGRRGGSALGRGGQRAVELPAARRLPGRAHRAPRRDRDGQAALHRAGYVCKRPRWTLQRKAQAQPGWAKNG